MAERSPNRLKTLWKKEKLLVTSNFCFSHGVFKRLVLLTRKNQGLFGKGLRLSAKLGNAINSVKGQEQMIAGVKDQKQGIAGLNPNLRNILSED